MITPPIRWIRTRRSLVAAAALLASVPPSATSAQAPVRVERQGSGLTVVATDASLESVLRALARETGSRIAGLEHATERVNVDVRNADLLSALRAVFADLHVNYVYSPRASTSGLGAYVWLYGASAPKSSARASVVVDGADVARDEMPSRGYAPQFRDDEVTRLSRDGAFDRNATQASLLGLAKSPDPEVRIRALQTLAFQPTDFAIDAIEAGLHDESLFVRGESVVLLRSLAMAVDAAPRLRALAEHENAEVRGVAVMALGEQSGDEAERLVQRALGDEDAGVRRMAEQARRQQVGRTRKQ